MLCYRGSEELEIETSIKRGTEHEDSVRSVHVAEVERYIWKVRLRCSVPRLGIWLKIPDQDAPKMFGTDQVPGGPGTRFCR